MSSIGCGPHAPLYPMKNCIEVHPEDTINHILATDLKAARILNKFGIDFCTEGNKRLEEACRDARISVRLVLRKIREAEEHNAELPDTSTLDLAELTRFIEKYYHSTTADNISFIKGNMARVVRVHRKRYPEQEAVKSAFDNLTANLTVQMQHETFVLFPYIREMVKQGRKVRTSIFKSAKSPIREMALDRDVQDSLRKLDELTHHYVVPEDCTCNAFKVTYAAMHELERELHLYLSLEDDVLFPKALELESTYNRATWNLPQRNRGTHGTHPGSFLRH